MTTLDDNEWCGNAFVWIMSQLQSFQLLSAPAVQQPSSPCAARLKNKEAKIHTSYKFTFNWLAVRCKLLTASRHVANLQMCVFTRILTGLRELSTNYKARRGQILAPSPSIISSRVIRKHKLLTGHNQAKFNGETLLLHTLCFYSAHTQSAKFTTFPCF